MSDVTPRLKPDPAPCQCGCGHIGRPKVRAWGDGLYHNRGCSCRRCKGGRTTSTARRRENRIASDLQGFRHPLSGGLSGADVTAGFWAIEETSNAAVVRGFKRWWLSKTVRNKVARLFSRRGEAHALVLSWDGVPQVVVTPYEDFVTQKQRGAI